CARQNLDSSNYDYW
nr:immunoglobulin heavy chain junction region [Macaca mulatta]